MKILVVDDEPLIVSMLDEFLSNCGFSVVTAAATQPALTQIEDSWGEIDLVITDVCMPGKNGTQLLDMVKSRYPDVDVILLTAFSEAMNAKSAIRRGACAFLNKPISLRELEHVVNQIAEKRHTRGQLIHTQNEYNRECQRHEQDIRERMFLRNLYRRLLPKSYDWLEHSDMHIKQINMSGVGGDYVDVRQYGRKTSLLFLADVAGHGLTAAFACSAFKAWFGALKEGLDPGEILLRADRMLQEILPEEFLVTAFCGIYFEDSSELTYASAGHLPPIFVTESGNIRIPQAACGPALGLKKAQRWEMRTTVLAPGESLVLYTDGVTSNPERLALSLKKPLKQLGKAENSLNSKSLLVTVLDTAIESEAYRAFSDDITLLALHNAKAVAPDIKTKFAQGGEPIEVEMLSDEWIDCIISSSPTCEELLSRYLTALSNQPIPRNILDDVIYCIREMANNAIEWGNRHNPDLRVRLSTVLLPTKIMIRVEDEGSGFDPHKFLDISDISAQQEEREAQGKRDGGFGLKIVHERMDEVAFSKKGNIALLVKFIDHNAKSGRLNDSYVKL